MLHTHDVVPEATTGSGHRCLSLQSDSSWDPGTGQRLQLPLGTGQKTVISCKVKLFGDHRESKGAGGSQRGQGVGGHCTGSSSSLCWR